MAVQIGDIVIYQTQNGDLIRWPEDAKDADKQAAEARGEIYVTVPAIVTSVQDNDTVGLVVFTDAAVAPEAFRAYGPVSAIGGIPHTCTPCGWRLQSEAGTDPQAKASASASKS
jgi:hypothetical protein